MSGMFDLTGRVALVTGSSRGIGNALARGLAEAGATVVLHGLEPGPAGGSRSRHGRRFRARANSLRGF